MAVAKVLCLVIAEGEDADLWPLTADRAKPAISFGGSFRLIDFALSNLVNAGFRQIYVLTQYKSHSLHRHITTTWRMSQLLNAHVMPVPAQQRDGPHWYLGDADAVFQTLGLLHAHDPDHVVVLGSGQVLRMDPGQLVAEHAASGAELTIAIADAPSPHASHWDVVTLGPDGRTVATFGPQTNGSAGGRVSMGAYVFNTDALVRALHADAANPASTHGIASEIVPLFVSAGTASTYDYSTNTVPGSTDRDRGYWREIATLDDYFEAHMDLIAVHPVFNLYNREWPILSWPRGLPPAKFINGGVALESVVGAGTIVSGATVVRSVIGEDVHIETGSHIEDSVILSGARIGRYAMISRAILDKGAIVLDAARVGGEYGGPAYPNSVRTPSGITVFGKGSVIPR